MPPAAGLHRVLLSINGTQSASARPLHCSPRFSSHHADRRGTPEVDKTASLASLVNMSSILEKEVGTFEAKNRLSELVEEASRGGRIWITKRGRRVALLSSGTTAIKPDEFSTPVARFRQIRGVCKSGPESIKSLIEEGRP